MKKVIIASVMWLSLLAGCDRPADVASRNISQAADNFEVQRRIVFYDSIQGTYLLQVEGLCSMGNFDHSRELSVTCKTGATTYKKHFLGLADNVTYFTEQLEPVPASTYRYRVVFNPTTMIPNITMQ